MKKVQLKSNGSAAGAIEAAGGQVEYLAEAAAAEKKKQHNNGRQQRQGGLLRQLWDTIWLRRSGRKVGQNGHGFVAGGVVDPMREEDEQQKKRKSGSNSVRSSKTELRDGFDLQTVLDLDHNQKIELRFYGYRECALKSLLYYFILVISVGFMALVFHWNQHWALFVRRKRCSLRDAQFMLIAEEYKHSEASQNDAVHAEAMQGGGLEVEEPEQHLVYFVETVHRVGVEEVKEQFLAERRRGVEKLTEKEPHSSEETIKEKWFERFLKRVCLFEKPEFEVKIKGDGDGDKDAEQGKMSKSPDTVTTLVMDDEAAADKTMAAADVKKVEEIRIHEHFLKFLHFSVHFDNGVFESE